MQFTGKLQLIELGADDKLKKLKTDIYCETDDNDHLQFRFNFDFKECKKKFEVIINGETEIDSPKGTTSIYGLEVIELYASGFLLKFMLHNEDTEDGLFVATARFYSELPKIGFVNKLLYHFKL